MVIGAMLCILFTNAHNIRMFTLYFFALIVVVFRELAVTSIRLVASSTGGVVIAANLMGKMKTVTQIVAICTAIIEPILYKLIFPRTHIAVLGFPPITLLSTALMIYLTIHSGINYIVGAWKYLDPEK
jgi:phosphatidylglycerophosphate synthase